MHNGTYLLALSRVESRTGQSQDSFQSLEMEMGCDPIIESKDLCYGDRERVVVPQAYSPPRHGRHHV